MSRFPSVLRIFVFVFVLDPEAGATYTPTPLARSPKALRSNTHSVRRTSSAREPPCSRRAWAYACCWSGFDGDDDDDEEAEEEDDWEID